MMSWLQRRRERRWQNLVNGHDFATTQDEPNKRIEITCRRCGYMHLDVHPMGPPWSPLSPVETPCPGESRQSTPPTTSTLN